MIMKKLAMLTGGGDCPGLNAVIRGVTRRALVEGCEVIGYRNGWAGVLKNPRPHTTCPALSPVIASVNRTPIVRTIAPQGFSHWHRLKPIPFPLVQPFPLIMPSAAVPIFARGSSRPDSMRR